MTLPYLLAVLNSRLLSACYERWTNRLFGDKFPKVSKVDLAQLPIPLANTSVQKRLAHLSLDLNGAWQDLKKTINDYSTLLDLRVPSGALSKSMDSFWALDQAQVTQAVSKVAGRLTSSHIREIMDEWKTSSKAVNTLWSKIAGWEEECDDLVRNAFGMEKETAEAILGLIAAPTIEEALLPKTRSGSNGQSAT